MKSLNKVMLIGFIGQEVDTSFTTNGKQLSRFSIACNESWKDANGAKQERTEWLNIVAWGRIAEICGQYLKKGSKVYVEGKLQTRSWDDKNSGMKRYATEVIASDVIILDSKHLEEAAPETESPTSALDDSTLPF